MGRRARTAIAAAVCLIAGVLILALTPVPFVVWSPGAAADLLGARDGRPALSVSSQETFPTSGRLLLPAYAQTEPDAQVTLAQALFAYWTPGRQVITRYAVYPPGSSAETVEDDEADQLATSERDAVAAALRSARLKVDPVPVVASVNAAGPSADKLRRGDMVLAVRAASAQAPTTVQTAQEASAAIASVEIGSQVVLSILRGGLPLDVTLVTAASKSAASVSVIGATFTQGYRYAPTVDFALDPTFGGPTAGLPLALAVYDKVSAGSLLADRVVAATGTIDANGSVGRVPAVRVQIATAAAAGASAFLLPAANCTDVGQDRPTLRLVPVASLSEAVAALEALADPARESTVKGCP